MNYREEVRDLFSVPEEYFLAHCISADFAMGKGIVLEFNKRFDMKRQLRQKYPGYLAGYRQNPAGGDCILEGRVLNLVTKERYFHKPTLSTMEAALQKMRELCQEEGIARIPMPAIGAGLDRLPWEEVAARIQQVFGDSGIEILVCKQEPAEKGAK